MSKVMDGDGLSDSGVVEPFIVRSSFHCCQVWGKWPWKCRLLREEWFGCRQDIDDCAHPEVHLHDFGRIVTYLISKQVHFKATTPLYTQASLQCFYTTSPQQH